MDISKINKMCDSIVDKRNQIVNNVCHTCGFCANFDTVAGGICMKYQIDVSSFDECSVCNGEDFQQMFFE